MKWGAKYISQYNTIIRREVTLVPLVLAHLCTCGCLHMRAALAYTVFHPEYLAWGSVCVSLPQPVSAWHRTLALSASTLFKILLLHHLKMMWHVRKQSTLAPSTKTKEHQAPFRPPFLGNGSEAAGAGKSLRARGEEPESIGAVCPRSEAFYWAGPAFIISIMWPQRVAYVEENAINSYMSSREKAPF